MSNLNYPNCGALASKIVEKSGIVICACCDTSFPVLKWFIQPQPEMGDILLATDFRKKPIPGWSVQNEDAWELKSDPEPVLQASTKPSAGVHHLLWSSGWFDNPNACVSVKI